MLPIVQRELLSAARRGAFYRTRYAAGAAAGIGGFGALFWADRVWQVSSTPGEFLFAFTAAVATVFCCGAGLFLTVDAISSEKRQRTLGLLFLTELRGADIILGKLASNGATAISAFLTIFPIMAISICLGGVTGSQIWRMSGALLALLFFSLALGLFVSVLFEKGGPSIILFCSLLFLPTIYSAFQLFKGPTVSQWLMAANPLYPVYAAAALDPALTDPAAVRKILSIPRDYFWTSLASTIAAAILCLILASLIIPFTVRDYGLSLARRVGLIHHRRAKRKNPRNRSILHRHPVMWLTVRDNSAAIVLWVVVGTAGVITWLWNPLRATGSSLAGLVYPLFLHYTLKLFIAYQATRIIAHEKEGGLLELLLTTPMNAGIVLASKKAALRRHFLAPLIYTLLIHVVFIWGAIRHDPLAAAPWIAFGSMSILFMDYFTLSWLGLWEGLISKNPNRAFLRTVLAGLALPWAPFFFLTAILFFLLGGLDLPPSLFLVWGFASAAVCGLTVGLYALARVHYNLRLRLAEG